MNSPSDLVILMLGTNDFKSTHNNSLFDVSLGISTLIREIQSAPIEPGMIHPKILVILPPKIVELKGNMTHKFVEADMRWEGI